MKLRSGLTYEFKPKIPKKDWKNTKYKKKSLHTPDISCHICFEKYKIKERMYSCRKINLLKHHFHKKCLVKWFRLGGTWKTHECPVCRLSMIGTEGWWSLPVRTAYEKIINQNCKNPSNSVIV